MYMKLLSEKLSKLDRNTGGFFVVQKFFKGVFKQEVMLTIFDKAKDKSSWGYLYICENNVLLCVIDDNGLSIRQGMYELEPGDVLKLEPNVQDYLGQILNATPGSNKYLSVKTTNPMPCIVLNDTYMIFCGIQAEMTYGYFVQGSLMTIYLIGKDETAKQTNLVKIIDNIVHKQPADFTLPTPGISASLARINANTGKIVSFIVPVIIAIFLGVILWTFLGNVFRLIFRQ
jgi:hypothetical protein